MDKLYIGKSGFNNNSKKKMEETSENNVVGAYLNKRHWRNKVTVIYGNYLMRQGTSGACHMY